METRWIQKLVFLEDKSCSVTLAGRHRGIVVELILIKIFCKKE